MEERTITFPQMNSLKLNMIIGGRASVFCSVADIHKVNTNKKFLFFPSISGLCCFYHFLSVCMWYILKIYSCRPFFQFNKLIFWVHRWYRLLWVIPIFTGPFVWQGKSFLPISLFVSLTWSKLCLNV